ncbi:hypothetical protein GFY24_11935 [Nocardia sp. SYP-A9097]|uniref:hypothetical protein n=1 Tax=Nocardia sp. SYP-A9097 TaxID=2663237 RepID=UPI00129A1AC0|nr:hypothetical protein [Nocardia sp. SYP-A9097]MRH88144.1 hypothetical protein [Nocardia sp. SYP-A9097]
MSVVYPDPDGPSFLRWIDTTGGESWHAWILRRSILRSVAQVREHFPQAANRLSVGLHRFEMLAEFVLIGADAVLVLDAAAEPMAIANDFSKSVLLTPDDHGPVLGMFAGLWRLIEADGNTSWLTSPVEPDSLPQWPSLYKGNAVLEVIDEVHGSKPAAGGVHRTFEKWCSGARENASEMAWVVAAHGIRKHTRHFRPVGWTDAVGSDLSMLVSHAAPVSMEAVHGISLFELACTLNRIGQHDGSTVAACGILGEIVYDSIQSLSEFRSVADSVRVDFPKVSYPYGEQGDMALRCLADGGIPAASLADAVADFRRLGELLESSCTVAFRDAHLKNRIWVTDESAAELGCRLIRLDTDEIRAEIARCVVDIDFESAGRFVTPWDDVAHILFFEMSGLGPLSPSDDGMNAYEQWWGPVLDSERLLQTVLVRSTREACRRWWYARNMPRTYSRRYSMESTDAFLDLALWAASQLNGVDHLAKVLAILQERGRLALDLPRRSHPHIPAALPLDCRSRRAAFRPGPADCRS